MTISNELSEALLSEEGNDFAKTWNRKIRATAKLMKKAGTSADDAMPRLVKKYNLSDQEAKFVRAQIWGKGK